MNTLTAREVSKLLKVNYRTVLNLISSGKLKATKVGTKIYRITEEEVQKFINGGSENGISSKQ